jgi:hypothetical protein
VPVLAPLAPSASYLVALGDGLVTGDGGPIAGGPVAEFGTAAEVDLHAPGIDGLAVEPAGPCVNVRFETDEPATATVTLAGDGLRQDVAAGAGARQFSLAAPLGAFPPATALELTVAVRDRAGNTAASPAVPLTTPAGLLPLAITEVHANAAGPEPAQEFVEIRNLGGAPVELGAVAIADARGMDLLPAGTLASGAYALIVPSGFDAAAAAGLGLGGGTPLVRVDARIGGDGLGNSGEVTELRAVADGALISGYRFPVDVSAAGWSGKSVHRVPEDACDQQASWTRAPADATPGRGPP